MVNGILMKRYLRRMKDSISLPSRKRVTTSMLSDIDCPIREKVTGYSNSIVFGGLDNGYASLFHMPRGPEGVIDYGLAVYTRNSLCVEIDGTDYLNASSGWPRKPQRPITSSAKTRTSERIGICFDRWIGNYYHWMIYCVPKIILLNEVMGVNKFFIPSDLGVAPTFTLETLQLLGIGESAVIPISCGQHEASELCFVHGASPSPFTCQLTREKLASIGGKSQQSDDQIIFLCRGSKVHAQRTLINEEAIINMCLKKNIKSVDPGSLSLLEQVRLFSKAHTVISVHGAALTNILWMKPGGKVIEIATGPQPHYRALAENLGHTWISLTAKRVGPNTGGHNGVFTVNTLVLEKIIDGIL